jgi:hypothetical protein
MQLATGQGQVLWRCFDIPQNRQKLESLNKIQNEYSGVIAVDKSSKRVLLIHRPSLLFKDCQKTHFSETDTKVWHRTEKLKKNIFLEFFDESETDESRKKYYPSHSSLIHISQIFISKLQSDTTKNIAVFRATIVGQK